MSDTIGLYLVIGGVLSIGLLIAIVMALVIVRKSEQPTRGDRLDEMHTNNELERSGSRQSVLNEALKHAPGSYERKRLLKHYDELANSHEITSHYERKRIAENAFPKGDEIEKMKHGRKNRRG